MRDRKIGNRLIFILLGIFSLCYSVPRVTMHLSDLQHHGLKQAGAGVPFVVKVTVEHAPRDAKVELNRIDGLRNFMVKQQPQGYHWYTDGMTTFSKIYYKYHVRIDREGQFEIGPVHVVVDGKEIESNRIILEVSSQQKIEEQGLDSLHAWIELRYDKNQPFVVGQQIPISFVAYIDPRIEFVGFEKPVFEQFEMDDFQLSAESIEMIDGIEYRLIRRTMHIVARNPGTYLLPAVIAQINVPDERDERRDFFGGLFGRPLKRQRIISDAVEIKIDPLPPIDKQVDGVGHFSDASLSIDQKDAREGEGIVAQFSIAGSGIDIKKLPAPSLQLPPCMKFYESKQTFDVLTKTKHFEYIIQVMKSGDLEIPAQTFTFYDPYKQSYALLETKPIPLSIRPVTMLPLSSSGTLDLSTSTPFSSALSLMESPWYPISIRMISWWWFALVSLLLLFIALIRLIALFLCHYIFKNGQKVKHMRAFSRAKKSIALYESQQNVSGLYQIFIITLAARFGVDEGLITEQFIEDKLKEYNFSDKKIEQWRQFFNSLTEVRFFSQYDIDQPLFSRSRYWIIELEKRL